MPRCRKAAATAAPSSLHRRNVGKGGIVREPALHQATCDRVSQAVRQFGFETEIIDSPILGAEGNKEFLLYAHH